MTATTIIRQGESLPFQFDRGDESIEDWTCTIEVKQYPSDTAVISRVITPTGSVWEGFLTSTETNTLTTSTQYRIVGVLTNSTTDEEEQITYGVRFFVTESWAT